MPKIVSPTQGIFSEQEAIKHLGLKPDEGWLFAELVNRRGISAEANGMYSEFSISRARSSREFITFVSNMRREKTKILALRQERAGRTPEGRKAARYEKILEPSKVERLESEIQELRDQLTKALAANQRVPRSGVSFDDDDTADDE